MVACACSCECLLFFAEGIFVAVMIARGFVGVDLAVHLIIVLI